jgi:hypothetical protein
LVRASSGSVSDDWLGMVGGATSGNWVPLFWVEVGVDVECESGRVVDLWP